MVIANATTMGLFGTSLRAFVTNKTPMGGDMNNNSWEITAKELFDLAIGGNGGIAPYWQDLGGLPKIIRYNFDKHGMMMIGTIVAAPVIEKMASRALKSVRNPINRTLKGTGVMV